MADPRDINRWRKGKEEWNEWAESDAASSVDFSNEQFGSHAVFDEFIFPAGSKFQRCRFNRGASFRECIFRGEVDFNHAQADDLNFEHAKFHDSANFDHLTCNEICSFEKAIFYKNAKFDSIQFLKGSNFKNVEFKQEASFQQTRIQSEALFELCKFLDRTDFSGAQLSKSIFDSATFKRDISFNGVRFEGNTSFKNISIGRTSSFNVQNSNATESLDFSGSVIIGKYRLINLNAKGKVDYSKTKFSSVAIFEECTFESEFVFKDSSFQKNSKPSFRATKFMSGANFENLRCLSEISFESGSIDNNGLMSFHKASFSHDVDYRFFIFDQPVSFVDADFHGQADFRNIRAKYEFDLSGARFRNVPNFLFSQFSEPPSFEGVTVSDPLNRQVPSGAADCRPNFLKWFGIARNSESSLKYRKLKSLAIDGHDHRRELDFFAGEIQAKRFWHDKATSAAFIFGLVYEWTSNFGRSLIRPLIGLAGTMTFFSIVYLLARGACTSSECGMCDSVLAGDALALSFVHSFPFLFWGRSETLKSVSFCLYGQSSLPLEIVIIAVLQNVISIVFVFLILLALRNQFKIR